MKRTTPVLGAALVGAATLFTLGASSFSAPGGGGRTFEVTVTNLTGGRIFSPLLVAAHTDAVSLFQPGQAASSELALLAEEGDNSMLATLLMGTSGVADVATGSGMVMPGQSETVQVEVLGDARRISMASMLVSTNDTFAAVRGVGLPKGDLPAMFYAEAWDAGSEANSESCAYVPGPPCGAAGMHDPAPAEGYVYISPGIQGVGDLDPAARDWRNPVALVTIRRVVN